MANHPSPGELAGVMCRYRRGETTPHIARSMHLANSAVVAALDKSKASPRDVDGDFWLGRANLDDLRRGRRALVAATLRMAIRDAFVPESTRPDDHPGEYEEDGEKATYYNRDEAYEWLFGDTASLMWDILGIDPGEARKAIRQWREDGVELEAHGYGGDKWHDAEGREIKWTRKGWLVAKDDEDQGESE